MTGSISPNENLRGAKGFCTSD